MRKITTTKVICPHTKCEARKECIHSSPHVEILDEFGLCTEKAPALAPLCTGCIYKEVK